MSNSRPTAEQLQKGWGKIRRQVREHWAEVSEEDLGMTDKNPQKLIAIVHQKTGASIPEIEEKIDEIAQSSEGVLDRVTRTVQDAASKTVEHASNLGQYVSDAKESSCHGLEEAVSKSPITSIGIAFGFGLGVGVMATLAMGSRPSRRIW